MTGSEEKNTSVELTYYPETGTYHTYHDFDGQRPVGSTIALALETIRSDEEAFPRLFDVIDPDSLNTLFEPTARHPSRDEGRVTFPVGGYEVTFYADGGIVIRPPESGSSSE